MERLHSYWTEVIEQKQIKAAELINESHALLLSVRMVLTVLDGPRDLPAKGEGETFQINSVSEEHSLSLAQNLVLTLKNLDCRIIKFLSSAESAVKSASFFNATSYETELSVTLVGLVQELEMSMGVLHNLLKKR